MATTLLRNGSIYSPAAPHATAMVVDGTRIGWVGGEGAADAHAEAVDSVQDLAGALVTPAFVDAHVHATSTGLVLTGLDVTETRSLAECLAKVEHYARHHPGQVVLGHGWDETRWPEHRPPSRQELDQAAVGALVYLTRIDVHSAVVSSAVLEAAPHVRGEPGFTDSGHLTAEAHHVVRRVARSR